MARRATAETEEPSSSLPTITGLRRGGGPASWPIQQKLTALVALPTALLIGFIGLLVTQSYTSWSDARTNGAAAKLVISANSGVTAVDRELVTTVDMLLRSPKALADMPEVRKNTDAALDALDTAAADAPVNRWTPIVRANVADLATARVTLQTARNLADAAETEIDSKTANREVVTQAYDVTSQPLRDLVRSLSSQLTASRTGQQSSASASALVALSGASEAAAKELALVSSALQRNAHDNQAKATNIEQTIASQTLLLNQAAAYADLTTSDHPVTTKISQIQAMDSSLDNSRQSALIILRSGGSTQDNRTENTDREARVYSGRAGERLAAIGDAVTMTTTLLQSQVSQDQRNALLRLIGLTGLGIGSLLMVSLLVSSLGRTITGPMRRLRSGAVDAATVRLPAAVRQIEREGPDAVVAVPPVLPIEAGVGPETREVAQALDGLTGEAVRLATSQVRLRQSLDEAFVSMSRRSQAMVEKQLAIIDELESTEEDPEQLRNLFRLDHLAARMRRYNDNLLVLAGSAVRTRSTSPVAVADVFRAATSEMEQYERVRLQPLAGASISGTAAGGLIHLLAELLDNAAMYSPPTSPIVLAASYQPDGGLRLEVTDSGVGIPGAELNDLNARLATPGAIDTQVPSRMGLFVVGRLAQRGGFTVRLAARAQAAGTVAEVMVPRNLVLGAPTGPIELPPMSPTGELSRLPAQHGSAGAISADTAALGRPTSDRSAPLQPPREATPSHSSFNAGEPTTPKAPAPGAVGPEGLPVRPVKPAAPAARETGSQLPTREPGASTKGASSNPLTAPGGLPARRPGAALSANPLGNNPLSPLSPPPSTPAAPTARRATPPADSDAPTAGPSSASPFGETPPWATARGPRRNGAAAGIDAAKRLSGSDLGGGANQLSDLTPSARSTDPTPPVATPLTAPQAAPSPTQSTSAPNPTPLTPISSEATSVTLPRRRPGGSVTERTPFSDGATPSQNTNPFEPPSTRPPVDPRANSAAPPGRRPGARPLPVRAPGQPGAAASAATAVAAAASARLRPISAVPNGLFGTSTTPPADARQKTPAPSTPAPSTPAPSTPAPSTPAPSTQSTEAPTSAAAPVENHAPADVLSGSGGETTAAPATASLGTTADPMPFEAEARAAAAAQYQSSDPASPLITGAGLAPPRDRTPIFDSISVWFADENTAVARNRAGEPTQVIDLREGATAKASRPPTEPERPAAPENEPQARRTGGSGRWSSLGDQRWIATNRRAAAAPETAGSTQTGLPLRRPGANLLPSAAAAAGAPTTATTPPARRTDAESVRGRLGSYQRGLSSARRARHLPPDSESSGIFQQATEAGHHGARQGGDS